MISKEVDPSVVISLVNNNTLSPLALETTSPTTDVEMTNTNILIIQAIEYSGTTIPFYIYPSLNILIRIGKLSNEVVRVIYNTSVEVSIIYQTYVDKYKFNNLSTRMTFHRFGHTREYYEVIEEYVQIYKKKIKLALFVSPNDRMPLEILLGIPFFIAMSFYLNYVTSNRMLNVKFSIEGTRFSIPVVDVIKARKDRKVIQAFFPIGSKLPKGLKN